MFFIWAHITPPSLPKAITRLTLLGLMFLTLWIAQNGTRYITENNLSRRQLYSAQLLPEYVFKIVFIYSLGTNLIWCHTLLYQWSSTFSMCSATVIILEETVSYLVVSDVSQPK